MKKLKVGMAQLLVEGTEPERNFERAEILVKKAKQQNCDIVLLPETIDFAWTHPDAIQQAQPIPGIYSDVFCRIAREQQIFICVGLTEKHGGKRYNTAILVDDTGTIILKYSKINLLEVEFPFYEIGNTLNIVETKHGRIGVNICADNYIESTHIGKTLASMGADIILSPASWTVDYSITEADDPYREKWIKPLSNIARLYDVTVVSATSVGYIVGGPYEGKKMVGCSLAVNKDGIIAQGQFNEFAGQLVCFETELKTGKLKGTQIGKRVREMGVDFEKMV